MITLLYCLVSLGSGVASKCWNGMSQRPLGQVMVLAGRQCQHQPPATAEYTGHISCQELTLARQCLWQKPASPCLPAGTSRRGQERRKQIKGEAEQLVTRSWQLSPGFPAQPLQQSSLSGPSSAHSRMGGSCSCICRCQDGKAGWGISICNATRPQGKSRHNGQQLAMVFFPEGKGPGPRAEGRAICRTQKSLIIIIIKNTNRINKTAVQNIYCYFSMC